MSDIIDTEEEGADFDADTQRKWLLSYSLILDFAGSVLTSFVQGSGPDPESDRPGIQAD